MPFIDYHKAFDPITTETVLKALDDSRIDSRYFILIKHIILLALNFKGENRRRIHYGDNSPTEELVKQCGTNSPKLFTVILEDVFQNLEWDRTGIHVAGKSLNNLRFADNIILMSSYFEAI